MSANNIWFPFYVADYLKDTQHLNVIEHGMYFKFMLFMYSNGKPIPHSRRYAIADAAALPADMLGSSAAYEMADGILEEFFQKKGEVWTHKRVEQEIDKQKDFSKKQSDRAKKRWDKKGKKKNATAKPAHSRGNAISQSQSQSKKDKDISLLKKDDLNALWREPIKMPSGLTLTAHDAFKYVINAYPSSKTDKTYAGEIFLQKGLADTYEKIIIGIQAWEKSSQWQGENGKYIPKLSTFLEKSTWEMTPEPAADSAAGSSWDNVNYDPSEMEGVSA